MTKEIDPLAKSKDPKVFSAEVLPPPGSMGRVPDVVTLNLNSAHGWSKETLIMKWYFEYKTNLLSRNNLKALLKQMNQQISVEEAAQFLVKEAAKI